MPAGWIYYNALIGIANSIGSEYSDLTHTLLQSLTEVNGGYLDLKLSPIDDLKRTHAGLSQFTVATVDAGAEALHNPDFFQGYVEQLREFENLLEERLGELDVP